MAKLSTSACGRSGPGTAVSSLQPMLLEYLPACRRLGPLHLKDAKKKRRSCVKSVNERREPLLYPRRRSRPGCTDASFGKMPAAERKGGASPLGRGGLAGGDAHASLGFDRRAVGGETDPKGPTLATDEHAAIIDRDLIMSICGAGCAWFIKRSGTVDGQAGKGKQPKTDRHLKEHLSILSFSYSYYYVYYSSR
uniref:Uncharacterized protein n=1 Tax=Oryza nivara TaxID=4536 RepID=A0A0E0GHK3_ORYNI